MDERIPSALATTDGTDALPASAVVPQFHRLGQQLITPDADSTAVYFGDAESVREGFSLALSLMQASGDLLLPDVAPPAGHLTQEDN